MAHARPSEIGTLVLVAHPPLTSPAVFKPSGVLPAGFVAPCLPTKAAEPPSGGLWLHEIKHDGFRIIARKDDNGVRLYSRPAMISPGASR